MDFTVPSDHKMKLKESEKKDRYLDFAWKLKKKEHKDDNYTNRNWRFWHSHQWIIKGTGRREGRRTSGVHPNYSIIENCQNTKKRTRDLRKLAVTQTPVKDHRLKLM